MLLLLRSSSFNPLREVISCSQTLPEASERGTLLLLSFPPTLKRPRTLVVQGFFQERSDLIKRHQKKLASEQPRHVMTKLASDNDVHNVSK